MSINLTWDLFVIVFFSIIVAYSFIIGRNQTLKIIVSSYIAILASDGIGNMIERYFIGDMAMVDAASFSSDANALIIIKILIFVFTIVLITTRGRFTIDMGTAHGFLLSTILTLSYGVLSAGLIISTMLIYVSGLSLVAGGGEIVNEAVMEMYRQSYLVQIMIDNYNVWFSLPAVMFVMASLIRED